MYSSVGVALARVSGTSLPVDSASDLEHSASGLSDYGSMMGLGEEGEVRLVYLRKLPEKLPLSVASR